MLRDTENRGQMMEVVVRQAMNIQDLRDRVAELNTALWDREFELCELREQLASANKGIRRLRGEVDALTERHVTAQVTTVTDDHRYLADWNVPLDDGL